MIDGRFDAPEQQGNTMSRTSRSQASWIKSWVGLAAFVALATSACSSGRSSSLTLNTTTTGQSTDAGADASVPPDAGTSDAGISLCGRLLVDRVRVVVRRIDLERAPVAVDAGTDGGMPDAGKVSCDCPDGGTVCVKPGGDVHIGPFLVDVAGSDLAGGIHQVFDVEVPQGNYEEVRFVINTVSRRQASADAGVGGDGGLSEMKDLHASIAVDGSFGGSRFRFTTGMRVRQKQEGSFQVGPGTKNITLTLDPKSWFIGRDGELLDPTDPRNRGLIKANIRCSVRMSSEDRENEKGSVRREFEDDDRGDQCREDDDDEDGEHGDGQHGDGEHGDGEHCDGQHGGTGDQHGDCDHHGACSPTPALVCGDGGTPSTDGGTDGGVDGGTDGGVDGGTDGG